MSFLAKIVDQFWETVDAILEDVPVIKTTFWCKNINLKIIIFQWSKIYGNPIRVTRLNFAPVIHDVKIIFCWIAIYLRTTVCPDVYLLSLWSQFLSQVLSFRSGCRLLFCPSSDTNDYDTWMNWLAPHLLLSLYTIAGFWCQQ